MLEIFLLNFWAVGWDRAHHIHLQISQFHLTRTLSNLTLRENGVKTVSVKVCVTFPQNFGSLKTGSFSFSLLIAMGLLLQKVRVTVDGIWCQKILWFSLPSVLYFHPLFSAFVVLSASESRRYIWHVQVYKIKKWMSHKLI